jgi:DNA processing protein
MTGLPSTPLPPEAHVLALSTLPGMGPRRLAALLDQEQHAPAAAWAAVVAGSAARLAGVAAVLGAGAARIGDAWRAAARGVDPAGLWARHQEAGYRVLCRGSDAFPAVLAADREPPEVLLVAGDIGVLDGPRVAIVGTRRCTRYGRDIAETLGRELAAAGVRIVSGLALGIDGAAHVGALEAGAAAAAAPPAAVVATGLDVVYPRRHEALWRRVAEAGVVLTEAPLGTAPERWRFPARNRIIAALADVVVVVESHARGGSLITVQEALDRDRPVMAVPGPVRSPASAGTNRLLYDGLPPARDAGDVLVELGLHAEALARSAPPPASSADDDPLLDALGWEPATLDGLVARTGRPPAAVALDLSKLERSGAVTCTGGWWERVA